MAIKVSNYKGWSPSYATKTIEKLGLEAVVVGDGKVVTSQIPESGTSIEKDGGRVVLYTGNAEPSGDVRVPNLLGKTALSANRTLVNLGLNVKIEGTPHYLTGSEKIVAVEQSIPEGSMVPQGTVVTVTFRYVGEEN